MTTLLQFSSDKFELLGVVVKRGDRVDSGHYVSYMRRAGQWWIVNDEKAIVTLFQWHFRHTFHADDSLK